MLRYKRRYRATWASRWSGWARLPLALALAPTLALALALTLTLTRYLHYICTMAPDWVHMPLTIWYNGGPGAPSTYGLFQEFGPFLLTEESYLTPGAPRPR